MPNRLVLPKYNKVIGYEGKGNFAVKKYYQWPFSFFYKKKLKMVLDLMDSGRIYSSVLDYGSGPAEIFRESLQHKARKVKCIDKLDFIGDKEKYDIIVCASVLEFVNLKEVLPYLKSHLTQGGSIIGASPMDTKWSRFYFKLIKDTTKRHSHKAILNELRNHFWIIKKKEWFGLYFSFKGYAK